MIPLWIGILLAGAAFFMFVLPSWRHHVEMAELGTVSQQWLAEHRVHDRHLGER